MFRLSLKPAAIILCLCCVSTFAQAQAARSVAEPGDPARWYQNDSTPQEHALTLKKEAEAAYQEARIACRKEDKRQQSSCQKEAQRQLQQDLRDARSERN